MIIIDNPDSLAPTSTSTIISTHVHIHTYKYITQRSLRVAHILRNREKPTHMYDSSHRRTQRLVGRRGRRSDPLLCITDTDLFLYRSTRSGRYRTTGLCLSPLYKLVSSPRAWLLATTTAAVVAAFAMSRVYVYIRVYVYDFPHIFPSFLFLSLSVVCCVRDVCILIN